jgi:hypothetical protein
MSTLDGVFSLRTPRDLREKLEADFQRFASAAPASRKAQYAAFDFFVCAEHLADWLAHSTGALSKSLRTYPDGPLVSHIANGAKHFSVKDTRHTTVSDTAVQVGGFQPGAFQSNSFATAQQLVIELENGTIESVMTVATHVLDHWRVLLP